MSTDEKGELVESVGHNGPQREMAAEVREIFDPLRHELWDLHARWEVLMGLFGDLTRHEQMGKYGDQFFYVLRHSLLPTIYVTIGRMLDPESTMGHENVSLRQLLSRIQGVGEAKLAARVERSLEQIDESAHEILRMRNKRIAHADFRVGLLGGDPPEVRVRDMRTAIEQITDLMRDVEVTLADSDSLYEDTLSRLPLQQIAMMLNAAEEHLARNRE